MGSLGRMTRRGAIVLAWGALVACTPVYRNHGYVPSDEDLARVEVGKSTKQNVADEIGRPSSMGILADSGWYYVASRFREYGPREPQEVDRQVVAVSFDDKGVVANVERFGLEQGRAVILSRRVTETNIRGIGFLRQLLGNVGRLDAASFLK